MTINRTKQGEGAREAFAELIDIVARLRAPDGCPWDREQTHESLKPFFIEETYEVIDAIDNGGKRDLREELGDVLLQVVLHAQIATEDEEFDVADVARGISSKLITRHPHVFGEVEVDSSKEVLQNWEQIKKTEKKDMGLFDGLPGHLPGLQRAARMGEKAGRVGFDWSSTEDVRLKVTEELLELDEAILSGDKAAQEHEIGDLLFAIAQWGRHLELMPEEAMRRSCERFGDRFSKVEKRVVAEGRSISECSLDELEAHWQAAKQE